MGHISRDMALILAVKTRQGRGAIRSRLRRGEHGEVSASRSPRLVGAVGTIAVVVVDLRGEEGDVGVGDTCKRRGGLVVFRDYIQVSVNRHSNRSTSWSGCGRPQLARFPFAIQPRELVSEPSRERNLHSGPTPLGLADSAARMEVERVPRSTSASTRLMIGENLISTWIGEWVGGFVKLESLLE